ncbi:phosphonate metabolism protein PhnP [Yersinia kristensenii]|uniref:Phosphonate metabolism protein PhnP n=1 Tax=Yersinia kristensenii TaxID=28152 RepID=A0AB73P6E4_YERKR|nr:phosphonate metabolism protein PhnP [Yersinia kristensenii]MDA5472828.1 phosphonate metabolism protein PhnP [Yersinia kristensenii]MDA5476200.1 phosphonate metabolism protein PhnP [Yersinia kristensenii]MDA5506138.1 phosphonate metabolism protein PhnP [Yersinia kristensenii]NIK95464.1 phosphonate metabolism protein PhnP [Yersinia kristensenii]NIL06600.1 phosphonate metabolism protein PhnP [Yersinia kristensenii]
MELTLLGTGCAQQVPVFGCECVVCIKARVQPALRRQPCCAMLRYQGETTLIDAGLPTLDQQFAAGEIQRFLLTHYHMDHVQGLFPLRWGCTNAIPVYGPADPDGCDDLYKHPGILAFQPPLRAFHPIQFGDLRVTPVPLNHSKITFGYLLQSPNRTIAYLTDTIGLPADSALFLASKNIDLLVQDCSHPPQKPAPRNHNDVTMALAISELLKPKTTLLTHVSHQLDAWALDNTLPAGITIAQDNQRINL